MKCSPANFSGWITILSSGIGGRVSQALSTKLSAMATKLNPSADKALSSSTQFAEIYNYEL